MREPLVVMTNDSPYRGCKQVRQLRDYENGRADIPSGSGGIILGSAMDNTDELFMVLINNARYIVWTSLMDLASAFKEVE